MVQRAMFVPELGYERVFAGSMFVRPYVGLGFGSRIHASRPCPRDECSEGTLYAGAGLATGYWGRDIHVGIDFRAALVAPPSDVFSSGRATSSGHLFGAYGFVGLHL